MYPEDGWETFKIALTCVVVVVALIVIVAVTLNCITIGC